MPDTPDLPEPITEEKFRVEVMTSIQQGPDGKQWPVLHFNTSAISVAILLPLNGAKQLIRGLPDMLAETVNTIHQNNGSGIIPIRANLNDLKGFHP